MGDSEGVVAILWGGGESGVNEKGMCVWVCVCGTHTNSQLSSNHVFTFHVH